MSVKRKQLSGNIPSGAIMWFANRTTAPDGWAICDGTNGTPNLIGRYPLGATSNIGTTVSESAKFLGSFTGSSTSVSISNTFTVTIPLDGNYTYKEASSYDSRGWIGTPWKGADGHAINQILSGKREISGAMSSTATMTPSGSISGSISNITPPSVKLLPCMKL